MRSNPRKNRRSVAEQVVRMTTVLAIVPVMWLCGTWSKDCVATRRSEQEECLYVPPVRAAELLVAREEARKNAEVITARFAELIEQNAARQETAPEQIAALGHF